MGKESIKTRKTRLPGICFAIMVFVMASSCAYSSHEISVERGIPINQSAISQIVIGKSTRSDVFRLLGTPHSIFHNQVEFLEGESILYYSYIENRPFSSLDDKHYAMLYRYAKSSGKSTAKTITPVVLTIVHRNTLISLKSDELLLLINKKTNIVEDIAYHKETSR